MFGLELIKGGIDQSYNEAYETFQSILESSQECQDISRSIARGERLLRGQIIQPQGEVFFCRKEMIAPQGTVYGQIFLSSGAIMLFNDSVAPAAGWSCDLSLPLTPSLSEEDQ